MFVSANIHARCGDASYGTVAAARVAALKPSRDVAIVRGVPIRQAGGVSRLVSAGRCLPVDVCLPDCFPGGDCR